MRDKDRNVGRPRKENSRRNTEKVRLSDREIRELKEFAMLNRISKSEFIRLAIEHEKEATRSRLGLRPGNDEDYAEYIDVFDEEFDENEWN